MHKHIVISGSATTLEHIAAELVGIDGVLAVSLERASSLKPRGDVLSVYVLNRTADDVLRKAAPAVTQGKVIIALAEASALIDVRMKESIATDDDEALWEEMESQLRNHGRISVNYILLMALGGIIAGLAFALDPVSQAIAFVGASITSPGFEPLAKISQGLVLRRGSMARNGLLAALAGYVVLVCAAAASIGFLLFLGEFTHARLLGEPVTSALTSWHARALLPSTAAAAAGSLMVASLRDTYVVGPLMVLALIPATALMGGALACGDVRLAAEALARAVADGVVVLLLSTLVFAWKQRTKHRRPILP